MLLVIFVSSKCIMGDMHRITMATLHGNHDNRIPVTTKGCLYCPLVHMPVALLSARTYAGSFMHKYNSQPPSDTAVMVYRGRDIRIFAFFVLICSIYELRVNQKINPPVNILLKNLGFKHVEINVENLGLKLNSRVSCKKA